MMLEYSYELHSTELENTIFSFLSYDGEHLFTGLFAKQKLTVSMSN